MVGEISRRVGSCEASSRANSPRLERVEASPRCLDSWRGEARRFQGMDSARRFQLWVHEASLTCDSLASTRLVLISADDQQTMLDTHILRPFQVDVTRKLLFEHHVEHRLPFLAIYSPALRRLLEYLDFRSVKELTTANTLRADCMRVSRWQ